MPLASLTARGFGIHQQVVFVHSQTLENTIFKLKLSNKGRVTNNRNRVRTPILEYLD